GPVRNLPEGDHLGWIVQILPELGEPARYRHLDPSLGAYHKRNDPVRQTIIPTLVCPSSWTADAPVSSYAGVHHHKEAPIDADNTGILFLNSNLGFHDLRDGSAYTLFIGEKHAGHSEDLGWMSGTSATLRNTGVPVNATTMTGGAPPWVTFGDDALAEQLRQDVAAAGKIELSDNPYIAVGGDPNSPLLVGGFGSYHPGGAEFAFADGSVQFLADTMNLATLQELANRKDGELMKDSNY
ncbi:MAG TPA: DUF1559 domain-containing protein, partial [Lacipirellula sp.]